MMPGTSPAKSKSLENNQLSPVIEKIVDKLSGVSNYFSNQSELFSRIIGTLERLPTEVDLPMSIVSSLDSIFKELKRTQKSSLTARNNITEITQLIFDSSSELENNIKSNSPSPLDPVDSDTINSLILVNHHKLKELGKIVKPLLQSDDRLQKKHDLLHERFNTVQSTIKDMQAKMNKFENNDYIIQQLKDHFQKQKEEITIMFESSKGSEARIGADTGNQFNKYDNDVAQIEQVIRYLQNFPRDKLEIMDKLKELRDSLNTGEYVGIHHRATSSTLFRELLADYKSVEGNVSQKTNQEVIDKFQILIKKIKAE
ncbi:MAG: hypothetical protein HeimC3_28920 [Candidatus Heimdallarchaeota archaeon LC_3]|nr:MAG: hypothetical protein HeimC3_28920 [Candidatus Heimdallarchaeota archaeon LC_3]